MMIKRGMIAVGMGMMLSAAPSMAASESTGWYFGATAGQAQADLDRDGLDANLEDVFTSGTSNLEDTDVSWALVGGYRITPYFSLEASYIDLGTSEYRASGMIDPPGPLLPAAASFRADFEVSGFTAAAVGMLPVGEMFQVHAQAGVLFAELEIFQAASVTGVGSDSNSESSDSRDFFFGVGAGLNLGEQWTLNLDWQRFKDVGDEDVTGETDIDRISLGVIYRL